MESINQVDNSPKENAVPAILLDATSSFSHDISMGDVEIIDNLVVVILIMTHLSVWESTQKTYYRENCRNEFEDVKIILHCSKRKIKEYQGSPALYNTLFLKDPKNPVTGNILNILRDIMEQTEYTEGSSMCLLE